MINVGGFKVFPQEIEAFLLGLPGVAEAKVRPVSSPITGQALAVEIVVAPPCEGQAVRLATLRACRQCLPRHQVPALLEVVSAIAVSDSGKKLRRAACPGDASL
jgi:acyl-CoA synthetase (AMP-forming)/AMP-acid ligase II